MDSRRLSETIFKTMAKYGWSDIHYSNPFLPGEMPIMDEQNRWTVGVRTGPKNDTICIKYCTSEEDVYRYTSPRGSTINEAVHKATRLYDIAVLGRHIPSCKRSDQKWSDYKLSDQKLRPYSPYVLSTPVSTNAVSLSLPSLSNQGLTTSLHDGVQT